MARRPFAVQNLVLECEPLCFRSIEKTLPPLRDKRHKKWSYHVYPELDQIRSPRENQKDDVVPQRGERGPDDANAAHVKNDEEVVSRNLLEVAQDKAGPPNERGCQQQDGFGIRGVTVEPLADGQAAVASILIHLPGDHVRLGVGCVLTNKMFAGKPLRSYRVLGT
ncbi:uncharacterized protein LOC111712301 [Eurytemora carolleeae]|uniref:uncharacterized protein LOC111712301 n=1 Tax=Eurytemora carolleeae TaxID=1294199 RepID=UPI000C7565B3|nr:uncharacterized protein LOC111712301 [Eurytemora carolleeae]|eukprot:XP_023342642.1 uncharacterized protein LOC111712301 [Eurytemora affinis]